MIEHQEADYLPFIQASVSIPDLDLELLIREAVIRFMTESKLFKATLNLYGQECIKEYVLDIPAHHVIVDILTNGVTSQGSPVHEWYRDDAEEVLVLPGARPGQCYQVEYYYHIPRDGCGIPAVIYNKYMDAIVDKTIQLAYTGRTESGVTSSLYQVATTRYNNLMDELAAKRMHKFGNGQARMRLPHQSRKFRCR